MATFVDFVSGRYSATWNAGDLGIQRQGFELNVTPNLEAISDSDLGGDGTILDMIYMGGNCTIRNECKYYNSATTSPFWPFGGGSTLGRVFSTTYPVGRLASDLTQSLVLTAVANTPAAAKPATLTSAASILAPGQNGQLMFSPKLRHVPLFMQLLPYISGSNDYRHFTTT